MKIGKYVYVGTLALATISMQINTYAYNIHDIEGFDKNDLDVVTVSSNSSKARSFSIDIGNIQDNYDKYKPDNGGSNNSSGSITIKPNTSNKDDFKPSKETEDLFNKLKEDAQEYINGNPSTSNGKDHREGRPYNRADKLYNQSNFLEMRQGFEKLMNTTVSSAGGSGTLYMSNYFGEVVADPNPIYKNALIQDMDFDMKPYTAQLKELASKSFKDITGKEWYADKIPSAVYYGLTGGYPDGTFKGNNTVTRAEFANMICNYEDSHYKLSSDNYPQFANKWYSNKIGILNIGSIGITNLSESNINKGMTRGEVAILLTRCFLEGEFQDALDRIKSNNYNKSLFTDIKNVDTKTSISIINHDKGGDVALAKYNEMCKNNIIPRDIMAGMMVMNENSVIKGDDQGRSNWNKPVTRAEAIVMFNNFSQIH